MFPLSATPPHRVSFWQAVTVAQNQWYRSTLLATNQCRSPAVIPASGHARRRIKSVHEYKQWNKLFVERKNSLEKQ